MKKYLLIALLFVYNIAMAQTRSKEEIMKSMIGNYELNAISASMGANSLVDYEKINGKWKASMSMLSMGRRVAENIKISQANLNKLNSFKITTNPDLSFEIKCNDINIATIPFKADGMVCEMKGTYDEYSPYDLQKMNSKLTFKDGELFIYLKDSIDIVETEQYNIAEVMDADLIILSFDMKQKKLNMMLGNSEGLGTSVYSFKKKIEVKK